MKKILVSLICCLTATLGWAQEKNAYTLFDAQGNRVDYTQMMDVLERQDVVFIGEIHNCPIAHWMEYEIVKDLYDRHGDRLMIGAEMFERDNQLILDEYLAGMITPERFNAEAKLWPNYKTDYSPIVEFAKEHKIPFVATNVARRYANMVAKGGFEALDGLSDEAKRYVAPLPLNYVPNKSVDEYFGAMKMPGMKQSAAENLSKAQAVKDSFFVCLRSERRGHVFGYADEEIGLTECFGIELVGIFLPDDLHRADLQTGTVLVEVGDDAAVVRRVEVAVHVDEFRLHPFFLSRRPFRIVRTLFYANRASVLAITSSGSGSIGKT